MKEKVLFVVAEAQEARALIKHFELNRKNKNWYTNGKTNLVITGPGVLGVIRTLSYAMEKGILDGNTHIINFGLVGSDKLDVGTVVKVRASYDALYPKRALVDEYKVVALEVEGVNCYTNNDFVTKADISNFEILNEEQPVVFDMELAYIVRFVNKSCHSVKVVSDNMNYACFIKFNLEDEKIWQEALELIEKILENL